MAQGWTKVIKVTAGFMRPKPACWRASTCRPVFSALDRRKNNNAPIRQSSQHGNSHKVLRHGAMSVDIEERVLNPVAIGLRIKL